MERKPKFKEGQRVQVIKNKYDDETVAQCVGKTFTISKVVKADKNNDFTSLYGMFDENMNYYLFEEDELQAVADTPIDMVNSPKHYCDLIEDYECYEVMKLFFGEEAFIAHCKCNALKYIWRHDKKGGQEDLKKAKWYLDKIREYNHKHNIKDTSFENLNKMTER